MKVSIEHVDGMRFVLKAAEHTVAVDAGQRDGGGGTAMSAPCLFAAAMGACILEFVVNSCRLNDVTINHVRLDMSYDEASSPRRIGALRATLCIKPDPPASVKRRLVGVARHATLVNTLERPPELDIQFAEDEESMDAGL